MSEVGRFSRKSSPEFLALVAVCAALNLGIGFVVATFKLPFYLDSIGTLLATAIGGPWAGIATSLLAVIVGSLYTPTLWAYAFTGIAIAVYTAVTLKLGFLRTLFATIVGGIGLGVVAAIVSAPVTAYLWGGVSFSGADAVTAYFLALGKTVANSVVLGGLTTDPIDKLFTSLIAYVLLKRVPSSWKQRKNGS